MNPLAIDLFCGLGGWTEGFLAEGYDVVGFDIERHQYGDQKYPAQLVLQDVLTLHGSQFRDAAVIVASPPCQAYSYRAMPWKRAKALPPPSNELFEACFRIQREAIQATGQFHTCRECGGEAITVGCCRCEHCDGRGMKWYPAVRCEECDGVGVYQRRVANSDVVDETCLYCEGIGYTNTRYIPLVIENVKGAQPWVGRARWHYGSFYLWGDVPALMPPASAMKNTGGSWFGQRDGKPLERNDPRDMRKGEGGSWFAVNHNKESGSQGNPIDGTGKSGGYNYPGKAFDGRKVPGLNWSGSEKPGYKAKAFNDTAVRNLLASRPEESQKGLGGGWFDKPYKERGDITGRFNSKSSARKAASAQIAKIPLPLSRHIARTFKP